MLLPEITAGKVNAYRIRRLEECKAILFVAQRTMLVGNYAEDLCKI
jgi:hypothetical protein